MMGTTQNSRMLVAVLLTAALATLSQSGVMAAAPLPWCATECGSETACDTACEYPVGETWAFATCGEYDGGFTNGWCDAGECDEVCGPYAPSNRFCYDNNAPSDCETFGDYAECDDGICANIGGGENCQTCPEDCGGSCPVIVCGDTYCQGGETFRNCPTDCGVPEGSGTCGDGICSTVESMQSCPLDCGTPEEFCDGWDYFCPGGYQCVGNQCVADEAVLWLTACWLGDWLCDEGEVCREVEDFMTGQPDRYCLPWWVETR